MQDTEALRQALMARAMQVAPQEPEPMDPLVMQQFENASPLDMPFGAAQGALGGMVPDGALPPEAMLEMEKQRVKEMLKRVRQKELEQEVSALQQSRMMDIENESNEMFEPKKKSGGY